MSICEFFWPSWAFPNWTGTPYPPPIGFVTACLIWDPADIEPELWIPEMTIQAQPFDPVGNPFAPTAWYWRLRCLGLEDRLNAAFDGRETVDRDRIAAFVGEAADEAARAALPGALVPSLSDPIGFIPLVPGTSASDLKKAVTAAMPRLDKRNQLLLAMLKQQAHNWDQRGVARTEIAGRLGVDRSTVYEWLSHDQGATPTVV